MMSDLLAYLFRGQEHKLSQPIYINSRQIVEVLVLVHLLYLYYIRHKNNSGCRENIFLQGHVRV